MSLLFKFAVKCSNISCSEFQLLCLWSYDFVGCYGNVFWNACCKVVYVWCFCYREIITDADYCLCKAVVLAWKCLGSCVLFCVCVPVMSADGHLKPPIDAVAIERDSLLHQVALCCLLNIVDLPFLDGIANHTDSEQVGWPFSSCCNGLKLTYENPLFASLRLLFHLSSCH